MVYVNVENHSPEQAANCNRAKKEKMAKNAMAAVRVTKKLVCVHASKVLLDKRVNWNVTRNAMVMAAVSLKHQHDHYVIVNQVTEVLVVKYKLAALEIKAQKVHVLEMVIV